jgi:hypothetical protein
MIHNLLQDGRERLVRCHVTTNIQGTKRYEADVRSFFPHWVIRAGPARAGRRLAIQGPEQFASSRAPGRDIRCPGTTSPGRRPGLTFAADGDEVKSVSDRPPQTLGSSGNADSGIPVELTTAVGKTGDDSHSVATTPLSYGYRQRHAVTDEKAVRGRYGIPVFAEQTKDAPCSQGDQADLALPTARGVDTWMEQCACRRSRGASGSLHSR